MSEKLGRGFVGRGSVVLGEGEDGLLDPGVEFVEEANDVVLFGDQLIDELAATKRDGFAGFSRHVIEGRVHGNERAMGWGFRWAEGTERPTW